MTVLGIILAVLILLGLLRVGGMAEYSEDGLSVAAYIGWIPVHIYPPPERKAADKQTEKRAKKKKEKKKKAGEKQEKKPGNLKFLLKLIRPALKALGRFRRRIRIDRLYIRFIAAVEDDPARAAVLFGGASAGLGMLLPLLDNHFRLKKRDIQTSVDFQAAQPKIYLTAKLSLAVWEGMYIAFGLLIDVLKAYFATHKQGKVDKKNGKTSDRGIDGNDDAEDS